MPDLLERGLILFNEERFYDAHEVWEDLWRLTPERPLKKLYQGLIQAAVGLHHLSRQNPAGALSQLQKSIHNLQDGEIADTKLDIPDLIEQLGAILKSIKQSELPATTSVRIARLQ